MAVRIRLRQIDKVHHPIYRIVVVDSHKKHDGRVTEEVGKYDPNQEPSLIELGSGCIQHRLDVGAQPSDAVHRSLVLSGDQVKLKGARNIKNRIRTEDGDDGIAAVIKAADDATEETKTKETKAEAKTKKEVEAAKAAAESEKVAGGTPAGEAPVGEKIE